MTAADRLNEIEATLPLLRNGAGYANAARAYKIATEDVPALVAALRAVLDLHRPGEPYCPTNTAHDLCPCAVTECLDCFDEYPCPTVRAIEEALNA